jgi:predicted nucleic acid-binding protein
LIAATALERGLAVVTIDTDFQAVPNLPTLLLDRQTLRAVEP